MNLVPDVLSKGLKQAYILLFGFALKDTVQVTRPNYIRYILFPLCSKLIIGTSY